jgi:hypothetical protein
LYALGCKGQFVCDVTKIDSNIEYVLEDLVWVSLVTKTTLISKILI